jgi:hypothetical protein
LEFPNCLAIIIINYTPAIKPFSGAVAGEEKEDFCEGSFSHAHPLLCFIVLLYFIYFYLHRFIKNPKKLESLVVIFTCLLFVLLKWLILKTPSCVTSLARTIVILSALLLRHLLLACV